MKEKKAIPEKKLEKIAIILIVCGSINILLSLLFPTILYILSGTVLAIGIIILVAQRKGLLKKWQNILTGEKRKKEKKDGVK